MHVLALVPSGTPLTVQRLVSSHAEARGVSFAMRSIDDERLPALDHRYITQAAYLRLLIPDVVTEADRVIYLDVDLAVMRDLRSLWMAQLNGYALAAVRDLCFPRLGRSLAWSRLDIDGAVEDAPYFNAGVMVMDLERWRRQGIASRAIEALRSWSFRCLEQDALNVVIGGCWKALDPRWNVFPVTDSFPERTYYHLSDSIHTDQEFEDLERGAFVLHFVGSRKPWQDDYPRTRNWRRYRHWTR
jgi:lipopolysaccharide biosynthesis glycosyltransferase